jgi:enterochelin esterase-like enzyme
VTTRRAFLAAGSALMAGALLPRGSRAAKPAGGSPFGGALVVPSSAWAHPIEPPAGLEFRTLTIDAPKLDGKPGAVVVAVPRDLAPGEKRPLIVLLGGGQHSKQPPDHGAWGWWSEFHLAEIEVALRRGSLTAADLRTGVDEATVATMNRALAERPHRGCVIATPFVLGRQTDIRPHGAQNGPYLRAVMERLLKELPVIGTRETTGLGGVSVGGMWALYHGPQLADLVGSIVAVQPYTYELERLLRRSIRARKLPQQLRIVAAKEDFLHDKNAKFVEQLRKEKIEVEHVDYPGKHDADFAGGAGGIDMMIAFDRMLGVAGSAAGSAPASGSASASASGSGSASGSASGSGSGSASGAGSGAGVGAGAEGRGRWGTAGLVAGAAVAAIAAGGVAWGRARRSAR